ncbi:spindle pole body interacting protein, partial [Aureobasidium melanogenum]
VQEDKAKDQSDEKQLQQQTPRQRYGLPRDTHEFDTVVHYNKIPVPIKIPTALSLETVGDFSLIKLIQTFSAPHSASPQPFTQHHPHLTTSGPLTHPIIVLLNALLSQKRIIFIGHNLPSSEVAEAVLAACSLASGGFLRGFTRHAFPYTDLTKIDDLLKVPGFIAGVTNPAFATHTQWWDVMCDLPTGRIKISPKIEQAPLTEGVLFFQQSGIPQPHNAPGAVSAAGTATGAGMSGFPSIPSGSGDPTGDVAFMSSVLAAIAERRGEGAIRSKFRLWV